MLYLTGAHVIYANMINVFVLNILVDAQFITIRHTEFDYNLIKFHDHIFFYFFSKYLPR